MIKLFSMGPTKFIVNVCFLFIILLEILKMYRKLFFQSEVRIPAYLAYFNNSFLLIKPVI
jgi:hypothetical protein